MKTVTPNKVISCGFIIHTPEGILACHATGKSFSDGTYDIPKGHQEPNESYFDTAVRELKEETGIILRKFRISNIQDLGLFNYHPNKDLYIIYAKLDKSINVSELTCTSTFTYGGKEFPEVDSYKFVTDVKCFFPTLQNILLQCNKKIKFLN